jgi:hypothetical protein
VAEAVASISSREQWTPLGEYLKGRLAEVISRRLAEDLIRRGLQTKQLTYRYRDRDGNLHPGDLPDVFWSSCRIDFADCSASTRPLPHVEMALVVSGIQPQDADEIVGIEILVAQRVSPATSPEKEPGERRKAGTKRQYDWDALQSECLRRLHDDGEPDNRSAYARSLLEWYERQFGADSAPDLKTLIPYLNRWVDSWRRSLPPLNE